MRFRRLAVLGLTLLAATPVAAQASAKIPPGLKDYKPHQIVERVLDKKVDLALSGDQVTNLTALHERVADEPHRFKHDPTKKPHEVTHVPMISAQQAFDSTMALLTPEQRAKVTTLFGKRP